MEGHGSEVQGKRSNYPASLRSFYQTGMTESISERTLDANLDNSDEWSMAVVLNSSPGDPLLVSSVNGSLTYQADDLNQLC